MPRKTGEKKDRTSLVISLVLHLIIIAGVGYWAWKSGVAEKVARKILGIVRTEKQEKKPDAPVQTRTPPPQLPKINEGLPPPPSSGTRRAVAADAPDAAGDSFFQDTRKQVAGPGGASGGPTQRLEVPKILTPPPKPTVPAFKPAGPSTIKELYVERAKAAAATEGFGSEQIAKTGVSDAGAIIGKVSGATVVDGKFAVIRGLSDRYVTTTFNGAEIPSADPYRRAASLDLFPAQIIDKVNVAKTFTPDQPGTYTGGGINIVSKSFPERPFINVSVGGAYNTRATGNEDFLTYDGGSRDWLGMDDGSRAIPKELSDQNLKILTPPPPNTGRPGTPEHRTNVMNIKKADALTKAMGTAQFTPTRQAPPADHNFSLAAGDTTHLFRKPFGIFAGLSYRRDYRFYDDGVSQRYISSAGKTGEFEVARGSVDQRSTDTVNWSAMLNLAYQLHPDHEVGFNFLFNQNGDNVVRMQPGATNIESTDKLLFSQRLQFIERNLTTFQLKGTDRFPYLRDGQFDWLVASTETTQDEPDTRFGNYIFDGTQNRVGDNAVPDPNFPSRYFRELDEQNLNIKLDYTQPFSLLRRDGALKFGVFDSQTERTYFDRKVSYQGERRTFTGGLEELLDPDFFGAFPFRTNRFGVVSYNWPTFIGLSDSAYEAESSIQAGYTMLDAPVFEKLRLIGGVRYEATEIELSGRSDLTSNTNISTSLAQYDLLPAAGLIYSLRKDMNLRLHYSETIARPSFRELAPIRSYDPILDVLLDGNIGLQMTAIRNYDLRWEWFPRPGEILSLSFFYKELEQPIERLSQTRQADIITYINRPEGKVYGIELEGRKTLDFIDHTLRYFSFGANVSLIESETEFTDAEFASKREAVPNASRTRPLFDQPPYILNAEVSYDNPWTGTSVALLYNVAGPRIVIANLVGLDIYERPAASLDFVFTQKLTRRVSLRFTAKNLLDPDIKLTYGDTGDLIYQSFQRGMTFGVSISAQF
jgi:hypothetical protein